MHRGLGLGYLLCAATVVGFTLSGTNAFAQQPYGPNDAPNIHKFTYGWAQLPDRRKFGAVVGVDIDRDGKSVWAFDRCESATNLELSVGDELPRLTLLLHRGVLPPSARFDEPRREPSRRQRRAQLRCRRSAARALAAVQPSPWHSPPPILSYREQ